MKDIDFHLSNERLEDLGSFALVFLSTYKRRFLFLHIWSIESGQLWSMTLLCNGRNKIGTNDENSVPCGSLSHFLVLDRFGSYQKKIWVTTSNGTQFMWEKDKNFEYSFCIV